MYEYTIIPISFKTYNEYVNVLNEYGSQGWVFMEKIQSYENSPENGVTTHDYVCYRKKTWKKILKDLFI